MARCIQRQEGETTVEIRLWNDDLASLTGQQFKEIGCSEKCHEHYEIDSSASGTMNRGWREALAAPSSSVEVVVWTFVWESVRRHNLLFFFNFCGAECLTWHFLNILKWQLIVNFFLRQTLDFPHLNIFCFKSFDDFVILCQRILEIAD